MGLYGTPACDRGCRDGCSVTAHPSLPTTDKAARLGQQLIPLLFELLRGDEKPEGGYDEASGRSRKLSGAMWKEK